MEYRINLQKIAMVLSLVSVIIGMAVLVGWKFDVSLIKDIFPNQITMKVNTAIAIILCGIAISCLSKSYLTFYRYIIIFISLIVLTITLLTLYQYLFKINFGIDELFIADKSTTINMGRMSPTTAFCLLNISLAIILSTKFIPVPFRKIFIGALSTTVIVIAGSIFSSYLPNVLLGYHILSSTSMGIHTSLALIFLSISLILFMYSDNAFIWVLSPLVTFGCICCLILILWFIDAYHNSTNNLKNNDRAILNLQEVMKELSIASINLSALKNSEYSYLISGNKEFLVKEKQYKNAIQQSLEKADIIIPNTEAQQDHLNKLKKLMQQRIYSTSSPHTLNLLEESKIIDQINQTLRQLLNDIDHLFTLSTHKTNINFYQAFLISPLGIYIVMFLLSLGIFTLNASQYERKKLNSMRNKVAAIVDSSNDGIISKDLHSIVTSWNKGAEQIFGYTEKEMLGKPIAILFPNDRLDEESKILNHIIRGEKIEHFETMRKRKDGKIINVSVTISPLKDDNNQIIGASKIVRDITDHKRLEKQLRQSQKMGAIGQLSGGIAHDFNNLLGIIIGNLDLLERSIAGNNAAIKRAQTALKAATRGADLTKRLLAFSRQQPLSPKPSNLNDTIHNLVAMASQILGQTIETSTDLDDSLPPVLVDVAELESALLNLVVNAKDAMPHGGKIMISTALRNLDHTYPSVEINEIVSGKYAAISVTDHGEGIPAEILEHVFEPFFTTKERGKGTGMGLSMVYGFAKQSQGTVKIYSEVGQGTTVTIYLPLVENIPLLQTINTQEKSIIAMSKVLVVDDEPDLLEVASLYLKDMGFDVYQANDGPSALETFKRIPDITLVMTDIVMPGNINGVELAKLIRKLNKNIHIIYVSGFPLGKFSENESTKIDSHFLSKPYQHEEFMNLIKTIMNQ